MLWACFKDEVPEALQCLEAALSLAVLCPGSPSTAVRLPLLCVPGCLAPFVRIHSETTSSARQLVSTDAGSRLCKVTVTEGKSHRTGLFPAGGMPAHLSVHVEASLTLLARFLNLSEHHVSTRLRSVSLGSTCPASHQPPCQPSCHCKSLIAHEAVTRNNFAPSLVKIYAICKAAPSAALCFVYKAV